MADLLMFKRTTLTGGGATAVDGISATALVGGELCWATVSDVKHVYQLNATSGATADGVSIIIPVVGTVGTKRWILQSVKCVDLYVNDLHLKNDIGDWRVVEGAEDLFIINNKTGKKYAFVLQEVQS